MDPLMPIMMDVTAPTLLVMLRPPTKAVTTLMPMAVSGHGGSHNLGCAVMILLQDVAGRKNKPMLPAEIVCVLPCGILTVGQRTSPAEHTQLP